MQYERVDNTQATPFIMTYFCIFIFKFHVGMHKWGTVLKLWDNNTQSWGTCSIIWHRN